MEKVIITAQGDSLDSELDPHFGRCKFILVCNPETKELEKAITNVNATAQGGAGVSTAQTVADMGISKIITGNIGPKAYEALTASGVEIYVAEPGKVSDALEKFGNGELKKVDDASAPMHTGLGMKKSE